MTPPEVFADGHSDLVSITVPEFNFLRRFEVPGLIKNIVGRQKGFGLTEDSFPILKNRDTVLSCATYFRGSPTHMPYCQRTALTLSDFLKFLKGFLISFKYFG